MSCRAANQWYIVNGMLVNESKSQRLVLRDTDYNFWFPEKDTLVIFRKGVDNLLSVFWSYIESVRKQINNQHNVTMRFPNLTPRETVLKLIKIYKAYILSHFLLYLLCLPFLWCAQNEEKLEALNKRILRFTFAEYLSSHDGLLAKVNSTSLCNKRMHSNFPFIAV